MSKNYGDKIMKKLIISVLLAVLFILSAGVVNAAETKAGDEKLGPPKVFDREKMLGGEQRPVRQPVRQPDRQSRRGRRGTTGLRDRLQRIDEGIGGRLGEHKKFIDELISIKKLAIEEKAEKTAKRIAVLIEARNAEFAKTVKKLNESRNRFREGLVPPGPKPAARQRPARPAKVTTPQPKQENKEDAKEEKKDKVRWWQFRRK